MKVASIFSKGNPSLPRWASAPSRDPLHFCRSSDSFPKPTNKPNHKYTYEHTTNRTTTHRKLPPPGGDPAALDFYRVPRLGRSLEMRLQGGDPTRTRVPG